MNPIELFGNATPIDAWSCGQCGKVHAVEGGRPGARNSEFNRHQAERCCTCYTCGRGPISQYSIECEACRSIKAVTGPPEGIMFIEGHVGPVFHPEVGFFASAEAMVASFDLRPDACRPTWAFRAYRDPGGIVSFDAFLRELWEDRSIRTGQFDPASLADLRSAFDRFNAANASHAPLHADHGRAVRIPGPGETAP